MESAQLTLASHILKSRSSAHERKLSPQPHPLQHNPKPNQVGSVHLYGVPIVSLVIESQERLCLAQISNTLLKQFSYNEIHNRRVALGITCVQCTPVQLEILRRAGAMPVSSRRCGMITRREAERLCKSFLGDNAPPRLPDDFAFSVHHECAWGCRGAFLPSRYNSSRAKCIKCTLCGLFFSPNKFIFHSHRTGPGDKYVQPDAANFNSWRRHMKLSGAPPDEVVHAWEDVKAMFNGGTRKRLLSHSRDSAPKQMKSSNHHQSSASPMSSASHMGAHLTGVTPTPQPSPVPTRLPASFPLEPLSITRGLSVMDYVWQKQFQFPPAAYTALPWLKRPVFGSTMVDQPSLYHHHSAFRPVVGAPALIRPQLEPVHRPSTSASDSDEDDLDVVVDVETTEDDNGQTALPSSPIGYTSDIRPLQQELIIPKPEPSPAPTTGSNSGAGSEVCRSTSPVQQPAPTRAHGQLWSVASLTERKEGEEDREDVSSSGAESRDSLLAHRINSVPFYRRDVRMYDTGRDEDLHCDCSECLRGLRSHACPNNTNTESTRV